MRWIAVLVLAALPVGAESLVATRMIRATAVIGPGDVMVTAADLPGALRDPAEAVGLEARVTIYPGRAIREGDLGPPAIIERNQIVPLLFRSGGLTIAAEGRALGRAGIGDLLRVMNLASRSVVTARVGSDGAVRVGERP